MRPLQICIGPTIRIGRESWCLPYAGFFLVKPVNLRIYFQNCCYFVCVSINTPLRSLSILFYSFTC